MFGGALAAPKPVFVTRALFGEQAWRKNCNDPFGGLNSKHRHSAFINPTRLEETSRGVALIIFSKSFTFRRLADGESAYMSRGMGRVELRILEILGGHERLRPAQITFEIAGRTEPTEALRASVGRALASLRRNGHLVRVMGDWMLSETWQRRVKQREHKEELRCRGETQARSEECSADDQTQKDGGPDVKLDSAGCGQVDYRAEGRRLLKILALLGSPHEGEVLNAARQAEQIRRRLRLSWEEMITLPSAETKVATAKAEYGPNFAP